MKVRFADIATTKFKSSWDVLMLQQMMFLSSRLVWLLFHWCMMSTKRITFCNMSRLWIDHIVLITAEWWMMWENGILTQNILLCWVSLNGIPFSLWTDTVSIVQFYARWNLKFVRKNVLYFVFAHYNLKYSVFYFVFSHCNLKLFK